MFLTLFKSKETKGKMPISPYNDLTFDFKTFEVNDLKNIYRYMVKNFVLNLPLNRNIRTYRRKSSLKEYYNDTFNYIILDFNDITNKSNQLKVIKYFKNYKCILGESRSNNGIDNFNIKGLLSIKELKLNNIKILVDQIKDDLKNYCTLDTSVSKIGSVSAPINRYNILLESNGKEYEYTYRYIKDDTLSKIDISKIDKNKLKNTNSISEICLNIFLDMGFKPIKTKDNLGNCINFEHDSEEYKGGYYWFSDSPFIMHHCNGTDNINIYSTVIKLPEFKNFSNYTINYSECLSTVKLNTYIHKINQQFITIDDDIKNLITKFLNEKENIFMIKSPMGTGKSNIIFNIIEEAKEMDLRILVCTNRISVANDSFDKYKLKIYNKDRYYSNDSFIVQYDSLYKYDIKKFDLVIFDEFISLLLHARNNINNVLKNMLNFFACFKKKLVIADAFLTGYENLFIENKKYVYFIDNDYRDNTKIFNYSDYNFFIRSILIHAKKHKITISCTSKKILFALKMLLENNNLKVYTLISDTPQVLKDEIYNKFKNDEAFYDVLIYSPTLTVGVSNLNNIDYHFHYDCSKSCDVISSLQMIKRTRKVKEIHFYIKNQVQYLKTTYNEIKDEYIQNLDKNNTYNCFFEYNEYGETRLSNLGKRSIQIDVFKNILEFSHKNAFMYLLKYQFSNTPENIEGKFYDNLLLPYIRKLKDDEVEFYEECLNDYFNLSSLDKNLIKDNRADVFETLYSLEKNIKNDTSVNIKNEILKIGLNDGNYFDKIIKYKIIIDYQNGIIDKNYIKNLIANSLLNDIEEVTYWNIFLNFESKIEQEYSLKTVMSNSKLKIILDGCGYTKNYGAIITYKLNKNIEKYLNYINIDYN